MRIVKVIFFLQTILLFASIAGAQWQKQTVDTKAGLRGLSVVNENVIWASGTGGTFLRTIDGGKTWTVGNVAGAEKLDFRDVEAFDANTAYLLSIGEGENSRIYKTTDGGKTWTLQFKNENPKAFFDAIAFWDAKNGIAMSDPVDGKYLLMKTEDGENWKPIPNDKMPPAKQGEAAFAASGTCLIVNGKSDVFLVSGGQDARVFRSNNRGLSWFVADTPIVSGTAGSGIFSIAMQDKKHGVIVGGNYEKPNDITNNLAFTGDGGKTWNLAKGLNGYRSAVDFIDKKTIIAVGASGSDISTDGGKTWKNLDKENYNAVAAKGKNAIWAVGANGIVARFQLNNQSKNIADLRNRILLYNSYFNEAQYDKTWELSSKNLREQNDNDKKRFINYLQKHGFSKTKIETEILSLEINDEVGKAKVKISIWVNETGDWASEAQNQTWVFEDSNWYFDDYKVAMEN